MSTTTADFTVNNQGSIFILSAWSDEAKTWVEEHIPEDALRWGPNGVVVEHRYIQDIINGMEADGLVGQSI